MTYTKKRSLKATLNERNATPLLVERFRERGEKGGKKKKRGRREGGKTAEPVSNFEKIIA